MTGQEPGGEPVTVAVLLTLPALTSPWVVVRVAVQVRMAPGARVVGWPGVQVSGDIPGFGSEIDAALSVTLPVLVATKM